MQAVAALRHVACPGVDGTVEADAVVLDVGEASAAVDAVIRLRGLGYETPVLLVSGYAHEWTRVAAMELPGVKVVPNGFTTFFRLQTEGYMPLSL